MAPEVLDVAELVVIVVIWTVGCLAFSASPMRYLVHIHVELRMAWVFEYNTLGVVLFDAAVLVHLQEGMATVVTYDGLPGVHYRKNNLEASNDGPPEGTEHAREMGLTSESRHWHHSRCYTHFSRCWTTIFF